MRIPIVVIALGLAGCGEKSFLRKETEESWIAQGADSARLDQLNAALDEQVEQLRTDANYESVKANVRAKMAAAKTADFDARWQREEPDFLPDTIQDSRRKEAKADFDRLRNLKTVDFDDIAAAVRLDPRFGMRSERLARAILMMQAHGLTPKEIAEMRELMGVSN